MKRLIEKPDWGNKCYKTKDDKKALIFALPGLALRKKGFSFRRIIQAFNASLILKVKLRKIEKHISELKTKRDNCKYYVSGEPLCSLSERCTGDLGKYCVDGTLETKKSNVVSIWDPEYAYLATGRRMSKKQLKKYCKVNNKRWENE